MDSPVIKTKKGISPIWILPIVALLIGAWLLYKDYQEAGISITIQINDASGLTPGKTKVMYKGLPVGSLRKFTVNSDLSSILAEVEMVKQAEGKLTKDTLFWVVRPELSINRITGLDTLVSGSYFEIRPGSAKEMAVQFKALNEAPPLSSNEPGLHLTLKSTETVALSAGSPVYFKKVEVGEVVSNTLQKDNSIETRVFIYPKYTGHVNASSLFYINSGIQLDANLPQFSLTVDPLMVILRGGISFITPETAAKAIAQATKSLPLYPSLEAAENSDNISIELNFKVEHGLNLKSAIRYNGIQIGSIISMELDDDMKTIHAKASIHKTLEELLRSDTYFWSVNAKFNADGISNLSTLVKGAHLELIPGNGAIAKSFKVHDNRPANMSVNSGLNIVLETDRLGSLGYDKPVYYRQVKVGHTTGFELSSTGQKVLVYVNIAKEYVNLIRKNTKFWNSSGLRIKGGLMTEMKISTESLAAIIGGGISFSTPNRDKMGNTVNTGMHFTLHNDPDDKWLSWSPILEIGAIPDRLSNPKQKQKTRKTNSSSTYL